MKCINNSNFTLTSRNATTSIIPIQYLIQSHRHYPCPCNLYQTWCNNPHQAITKLYNQHHKRPFSHSCSVVCNCCAIAYINVSSAKPTILTLVLVIDITITLLLPWSLRFCQPIKPTQWDPAPHNCLVSYAIVVHSFSNTEEDTLNTRWRTSFIIRIVLRNKSGNFRYTAYLLNTTPETP